MTRIVTVTLNPALDRTASIAKLVAREKLRCSEPSAEPGGGGVNVSRVIKALGGSSVPFITAGGPTGSVLEQLIRAQGLDPVVQPLAGTTRESVMIYDRAAETQYRFIMPGPTLSDAEWGEALTTVRALAGRDGMVVASGSLPPGCPDDLYAQMAQAVEEQGARFLLDTSGLALKAAIGAPMHVLKLDEEELTDFMGREPASEDEEEAEACALLDRTAARVIVITLGKRGALIVTADGATRLKGPEVKPVSTVGAGDSFVAALTKALFDGRSVADASRYAIAAGTAAVLTPGTELARAEDVDRIYAALST